MEYDTIGGSAMHKIIEKIGFGTFHVMMITILGLRRFVGGSSLAMVTVLEPYLRCSMKLSIFASSWTILCRSIGQILSPIIAGKISDHFGRKKTMLLFFILHSYLSLMASLSSSYPMILVSQTMVGIVFECYTLLYPYALEVMPVMQRKFITVFEAFFFCGYFFAIALGMPVLKNLGWRWYLVFTESLPMAVCAVLLLFLPESPRYLMSSGQWKEAFNSLRFIANMNGKDIKNLLGTKEFNMTEYDSECSDLENKSSDIQDKELGIWKVSTLKILFSMSVLRFASYSLSTLLEFATMQMNVISNVRCGDCAEQQSYELAYIYIGSNALAFSVAYFMIGYAPRKSSLQILSVLIFINTLPFYLPLSKNIIRTLIGTAGTLIQTLVYITAIYNSEVMPTSIRTTGNGIANTAGGIGYALAAFLGVYLINIDLTLALGIVDFIVVSMIVVAFSLDKETKTIPLQDS
eukprot:Seg2635.6 transcript_id=Seg2635.6/GoldUCD/mRNA.D3Y31 product="putative transporter SVOPL" protein_id=Seg2635.6/GoldUCD/D3Y31